MPTTVCTRCGAAFPLPEASLGKRAKCIQCGNVFDAQSVQQNISSCLPPPLPGKHVPPTAPMPADRWYYIQNKKKVGPVSLSQLHQRQAEGVLKPEDMVMQEGTQQWRPLATVTGAETGSKPLSKSNLPTVVARRSGPAPKGSRRMHFGWVAASFAALIVPILTASALTVWKPRFIWSPAKGNANPSAVYAGIEIGSNGPRYCLVEFLPLEKGGDNFRVLANEQTTARLTKGMEKTGEFDPVELRKAMSALETFYNRLVREHNVPPEQIVIVSSETLFDKIKKRDGIGEQERDRLLKQCRESLLASVKKATGQTMEFANLAKFAEHQLRAVVRKSDLKDAVFLDIGKSSTRGAYCDAADVCQAAAAPGIDIFTLRVKDGMDEDENFAERAAKLTEQHLREPIRKDLGKDPEFTARGKIYLAGGIAWVMANCQHPDNPNDYVYLSAADIEEFRAKVRQSPDLLNKIQPDSSLPPERQEWLKKEYARMRNAFKDPERLLAGAEILLALSSELQFAGKGIWFYRHSDFAWVASYIEQTRRPRK